MKNYFTYLVMFILFLTSQFAAANEIIVKNLRCEYLKNPIGIDIKNPRLSWIIKLNQQGQKQTAYQILVASNREKLEKNIGDIWDSGKVKSDKSGHIKYLGEKLKSRMQVFWKVRVWDGDDSPSNWSEIARWEMGLASSEWQGKWIGVPRDKQCASKGNNPAPYFRKKVILSRPVKKARVYISGLGYYELSINGKKVTDSVLSPNHTNYDVRQSQNLNESRVKNMLTRVLYETFDIGSYFKSGENVIGVCLGNGWYFQNDREEDEPLSYDTPRFIAQLEIEFSDGSKKVIKSDEIWKTAYGPILHNGLYNGELYDARLEREGWNNIGFDDSNWNRAQIVRPPEGKLMAQMSPPDRVIKTIRPISLTKPAKGIYRYDLGQLISGWVRLKIKGSPGAKIKLKFIEEFDFTFGQTDTYILKGDGPEVWEPRFTWHAFRYVDVLDLPIPLTIDNLEGRVVNTDVDSAGIFECSNSLFNKILEHYRWTQLGNMHGGIPSDCPHRERRGYTGDGQISALAAIYSFDMASFYTKWLNDIKDAQNQITGYVPNTAPYQNGSGGAAWGSAYIIIPWYMYLYYGDKKIIDLHYTGMKKWIDFLKHQTDEDGIIIETMLGEWVPPEPTEIPPSFVSTAYYYHDLILMSKMAKILEKNEDKEYFKRIAHKTKEAFHKKYFNQNKKSYSIGRQGANVFALGFGLVPDDLKKDVFNNLVKNIEVNTRGHFDTGVMGTPLLLDVLTQYGRPDLAYTVMNQRDFPSFGYTIGRGATTLWETWGGSDSHSHPMFGSVCQWFFQALAGINPDPDFPGFKHIILKPHPIGSLKFTKATYPSMYGKIENSWQMKNGDFFFQTTIPTNTTASVYIPAEDRNSVDVKGKNVTFVEIKNHLAQYRIDAGSYSFFSKNISSQIKMPMLATPIITPADTVVFLPDAATVCISSDLEETEIRYTLDGTEPEKNSILYKKPFKIYESTIINARVFKKGCKPSSTKTNTITFIDPERNGLNYEYFEGSWEKLPDFDFLKPTKKGSIYDIGLEQIVPQSDKFSLVFSGRITIQTVGDYTFFLNSNDGSKLFIDNKLVVDNDGLHGSLEKSGLINLLPGSHSIKITYFQAGGGMHLQAYFTGPETEKQKIPPSMLFKN